MKICIVGLGAVGGLMAHHLIEGGREVSALARGATLAAVRERGLVLRDAAASRGGRPHLRPDPLELTEEDLLSRVCDLLDRKLFESSVAQAVMAIGPSTASTTSASVIAAGGRDRRTPPPVPRLDSSRPAEDRRPTSFCAVGSGMPVSAARVVAFILAAPQWRAAADISTTA
jgi:2-dehydropantoate 2-reductase